VICLQTLSIVDSGFGPGGISFRPRNYRVANGAIRKGTNLMAQSEFLYSGEAHPLPGGRALVRGTRTSGGGRTKKHVFIEVECLPEEVGAVQNALAVLLQRHGRINATSF
jgi:hypothetical protein